MWCGRVSVDLSLEQRLLRFLAREEHGERRALRELRAQPIDARVLEGECLRDARYLGERGGTHRFAVADNPSKFRPGDPVIVGDGIDLDGGAPLACGEYDAEKGELRFLETASTLHTRPITASLLRSILRVRSGLTALQVSPRSSLLKRRLAPK